MQYCKVKEGFKLIVFKPSKISQVVRTIVKVRTFFKKAINKPNRYVIYNLSDKKAGKKELTTNIVIEKLYFEGKQVIKVKTNIDNVFLKPIK